MYKYVLCYIYICYTYCYMYIFEYENKIKICGNADSYSQIDMHTFTVGYVRKFLY